MSKTKRESHLAKFHLEVKIYVLKSKNVPPVCPHCSSVDLKDQSRIRKQCPPCPACARCPEDPFTCKKVPNYKHMNPDKVPGGFLPRMANLIL